MSSHPVGGGNAKERKRVAEHLANAASQQQAGSLDSRGFAQHA
jgi:hypothetical protein